MRVLSSVLLAALVGATAIESLLAGAGNQDQAMVSGGTSLPPAPVPTVTLALSVSSVTRTGPTTWRLELAYVLANRSGSTIYAEEGDRMPYASVPTSTRLVNDLFVANPLPMRPYMFELPHLSAVPSRGRKSGTITVNIPVATSDHFHFPSLRLRPLSNTFTTSLRIGYLPYPFIDDGSPTVLQKFLAVQNNVTSNVVTVTLP